MVSSAHALGIGAIKVRSNLGQALLAQADIVGSDIDQINPSCWRARVIGMDGVLLASVNITLQQNQHQRFILFTTKQHLNEPAVVLVIDVSCETQLHREFSILLDPLDVTAYQSTNSFANVSQASNEAPAQKTEPAPTNRNTSANTSSNTSTMSKPNTSQDGARDGDLSNAHKSARTKALSQSQFSQEHTAKPKKTRSTGSRQARGDVLKLSDEAILPEPEPSSTATAPSGVNLRAGLRMSDVLSSQTGQELLGNMQELRAAQARMAAILRDDTPSSGGQVEKTDGFSGIPHLKQEAEKLRKQNAIDRSSLEDLQKKSGFDFWLVALAIVAISLSAVIVMLLVYIQKRTVPTQSSWWEDEEITNPPSGAARVEEAINHAQASYENTDTYDQNKYPVSDARAKRRIKRESKEEQVASESGSKLDDEAAPSDGTQALVNTGQHRTPTLEETNSSIFNFYSPRGGALKVEEISDVTQEAEFWISMNDPQRAIEILSAQEQVDHPDSSVPWLFLLDLYRTTENQEKFNQLRVRFIAFFNANIPEYDDDLSHIQFRQLEDYAHLVEHVCDMWASTQIIPYLQSLLIDNREGKRTGFDLPVYRDILLLLAIARELAKDHVNEAPTIEFELDMNQTMDSSDDPVNQAQFGSIDFDSIDFPETKAGHKSP